MWSSVWCFHLSVNEMLRVNSSLENYVNDINILQSRLVQQELSVGETGQLWNKVITKAAISTLKSKKFIIQAVATGEEKKKKRKRKKIRDERQPQVRPTAKKRFIWPIVSSPTWKWASFVLFSPPPQPHTPTRLFSFFLNPPFGIITITDISVMIFHHYLDFTNAL